MEGYWRDLARERLVRYMNRLSRRRRRRRIRGGREPVSQDPERERREINELVERLANQMQTAEFERGVNVANVMLRSISRLRQ